MTFASSSSDWVKFYPLFIILYIFVIIDFLITPFTAITRVIGPPTSDFI